MNTERFLNLLEGALTGLPRDEVSAIVTEQSLAIQSAIHSGRTEADVIRSLGSPATLAASLSIDAKIRIAQTAADLRHQFRATLSAVFTMLSLAPLNLILVFFPFMVFLAGDFFGWFISGLSLVTALIGLIVWVVKLVTFSVGIYAHLSLLFLLLGTLGAAVFALLVMYQITRFFMRCSLTYLNWNLKVTRGKS